MASLEGQEFAGFTVLSLLGRGGMGAVYKARQPMLDRFVALKIMAPELAADPDFVARFKREAHAAASLMHENLVQVYAAGEFEGQHYIAMEFVDGETLRDRIERQGRLEPQEAIAITVQVAQALQYAWNKNKLIHRDIKPENIFLTAKGEVRVGDMGLAKTVGGPTTSLTQTGMMMGSPHYISPEQARGLREIDFRADIYSLGCTLYHMLTGRPPYEGDDSLVVINKHVNDPPPAIFKVWPTCPIPLALVLGKMVLKQRHERPGSYEELIAQLREVYVKLAPVVKPPPASASEPTKVATPTPKPAVVKTPTPKPTAKPARWSSRFSVLRPDRLKPELQRVVLISAGVVAVVVIAGAVWWFVGRVPSRGGGPAAEAPAIQKESAVPPKFGTLFDGRDTSAWQKRDGSPCDWRVEDGALVTGAADIETREKFQDFDLHIEFATPRDGKQGNSGVYLQGRYELQILESFGKPADDTCCGSIFKLKAPQQNVSKPRDEWQTFDISFRAARFDATGAKTANARVSVVHNGTTIHRDVEIASNTGKGDEESAAPGPIRLQAYGSPVRFRNISIKPLGAAAPAAPAATQQPRQTIDLLAVADPVKDRVKVERGASLSKANAWERRGSALAYISDGGSGKLAPPVAINARSYEIEVEFERLSGPGRFHVDLPLDATRIIPMNFDTTKYKMINCRSGDPWPANRGTRARVVVRLDRGEAGSQCHLTVRLDGELVVDFQGNANNVAQTGEPHPDFPGQPITSLYSHKDSYEVRFWQLRIFDGEAILLRGGGTAPTDNDAWQNAINLLPLIDLQQDKVSGDWNAANGELTATDQASMSQKLQPPYRPAEEYDYRVSFTTKSGNADVAIGLTATGRSFVFYMKRFAKDHVIGFEAINGKAVGNGPTAVHIPHLEHGRRYSVVVQVRKQDLKAYLDGKLMVEWPTDYRDMSPWPVWKFKDDTLLGFGCSKTTAVFDEIKVIEVSGKGTFTRGAPPATSAWLSLDISAACNADVISTDSRKAADQLTFNGGTLASASWLRKNGYPQPGLPDDGRVPIPDTTPPGFFQVKMPPDRNAMLLSAPQGRFPQPVTVELTASERRRYSELVILHITCWGNGTLRVLLHYETGADTTVSIPLCDMCPDARTSLPAGLRVAVSSHDTHPTGGKPAEMLAQRISADPQRTLRSLTFSFGSFTPPKGRAEQETRGRFTTGIFAISALPAVPVSGAK